MNEKIELTSEVKATLVDSMGNDESVVHAARVSIVGARAETEAGERKGLLNFLMRQKHASPWEHVTATFLLEVPIFVTREIHRHRVFSFNEWSARYSTLAPKFYIPSEDRPLVQEGKPGAYSFSMGSPADYMTVRTCLTQAYEEAWGQYQYMLECGIAKEVARDCLPVGVFTSFYMSGNLRNFLNFLSLRTAPDALYEIREVAFRIEEQLYQIAPVTLSLWDEHNRGSL